MQPLCTVKFVKRVDVDYQYDSDGDGEYLSKTTRKYDVLDIVEQFDKYYVVRTMTKQYSRYDRYESPMYYDSEHTSIEFCEIMIDMLDCSKEQLLEFLDKNSKLLKSYDQAPYGEPGKWYVAEEVEKILLSSSKINSSN